MESVYMNFGNKEIIEDAVLLFINGGEVLGFFFQPTSFQNK